VYLVCAFRGIYFLDDLLGLRFLSGLVSDRFCGSAFISLPRTASNFCLSTFMLMSNSTINGG
jgi:hypothetical protein